MPNKIYKYGRDFGKNSEFAIVSEGTKFGYNNNIQRIKVLNTKIKMKRKGSSDIKMYVEPEKYPLFSPIAWYWITY